MNKATICSAALLAATLTGIGPGCSHDPVSTTDDLTSVTARERQLSFEGYVYVHPDASDAEILESVRSQTRSAFGALVTRNVMVSDRELANVDPSAFVKEPVAVFENGEAAYESLRVRYTNTDRAVVPKSMSNRSSMRLGLLHGDYPSQAARILTECSLNTKDEHEMKDSVWYVFNPSINSCVAAMKAERDVIAAQRQTLAEPETQVSTEELERLYIPMTASLAAVPGSDRQLYPEYDRLWSGGVEQGKLKITLLNGLIDHAAPGQTMHPIDDPGYWETLSEMEVILEQHPDLKIVATDPPSDMSTFTVDGQTISGVTFQSFIDWEFYDWGFPQWMNQSQKLKLRKLVAERITRRWITFAKQVHVSIDDAPAKPVTIQIDLFFGVDDEPAPYMRGIRHSDVFIYNGHSFIGEGPLDPSNFTKADFPQSYQLLFIDSCLSFNYYNSDYFAFKERGTKDLDIITNALESWSDGAGIGQGRFVNALLADKQHSFVSLLKHASTVGTSYAWGKDALRVVDGELDNDYAPKHTPIRVTAAE